MDMDMQVSVMTGMAGAGASARFLSESSKSKRTAKVSKTMMIKFTHVCLKIILIVIHKNYLSLFFIYYFKLKSH